MTNAPGLPLDCRQPRRGGWKKRPAETREDTILYAAVLFLRRDGALVYRQGRQHRIDGSIADDCQMLRLAEHRGFTLAAEAGA